MRRFLARCLAFLRPAHAERELEREVSSHLTLLEEDFQRRGLTPHEAELAARRAYGSVDLAKELHRDTRSFLWLEQFLQDLRHAARSLCRAPSFAALAILTLALGVGVNTTLFTAYDALALRPLPVADPGRVVRLERWFESPSVGSTQYLFSYPEYLYCRDHNRVLADLVAGSYNLGKIARIDGEPEKIVGQLVSADYFRALGVTAQLGRTFLPDEGRTPGANPVVVISDIYWQRRFQRDPGILGRTIEMEGTKFTIVGVAARGFHSAAVDDPFTQFWAPLSMQAELVPSRDWANDPAGHNLQLLGRLKPTMSLSGAQAELSVLIRQFDRTLQVPDRTTRVTVQHTSILGNTEDLRFKAGVGGALMLVGMILLVACANIANMLLARAAIRRREIGVRLALGAGRARMIRHLLTESLMLAFLGGLAGLLLSVWTSSLLGIMVAPMVAGTPAAIAGFTLNLSLDVRIFSYAMALSLAAGIFFGLAPALQFTRPNLGAALKEEGSPLGRRLTRSRFRGFLVGAQVAVSMLLLITAGLLLRGLLRSHDADPGFDTRGALLLVADFGARNPQDAQGRLLERLRSLPELKSVATGSLPMMGTWTPPIYVGASARSSTLASYASERYLETLGIPLLRGRSFTAQDVRNNAPVAVVSEAAARRFWPAQDPIGKRFQLDMDFNGHLSAFEVIGIARDIRYANLTRLDPAHVYLTPKPGDFQAMILHASSDPRRALQAVRTAVGAFDPNLLPGIWLTTVQDGPMLREKSQARVFALFASILAALALLLASIGIYGVMSYLVNQRVKEIGVRMALGATAGDVLRSVVLQSLRPVILGMAMGIAAAAALSTVLHTTLVFPGSIDVLYGIPFYDPATFLGLAAFLTAIAALASAVPARRAVRIDPIAALRCD